MAFAGRSARRSFARRQTSRALGRASLVLAITCRRCQRPVAVDLPSNPQTEALLIPRRSTGFLEAPETLGVPAPSPHSRQTVFELSFSTLCRAVRGPGDASCVMDSAGFIEAAPAMPALGFDDAKRPIAAEGRGCCFWRDGCPPLLGRPLGGRGEPGWRRVGELWFHTHAGRWICPQPGGVPGRVKSFINRASG